MESRAETRQWLLFFGILLVARTTISTLMPLMDFSEARYAEIARNILVFHDWITPWFKPGVPFWGKPPMAFWSVAVSFILLGVNEFSARLPSLIFTLLTAALIFRWTEQRFSRSQAIAACMIYLSAWLVVGTAGSVITDPLLVLATTAVMFWFWDAVVEGKTASCYLMWGALGVGLLAKGPLALVLCGLACGMWVLVYNQWGNFFRRAHLFTGLLLMLAIALPWYYLAEHKTPGFLDYFIVGEHFDRYLVKHWSGDHYGGVKDHPFGTIWLFFIAGMLPWSLILIGRLFSKRQRSALKDQYRDAPLHFGYLLLWVLMPLLFFTFARNILVTYVMPAIPATAVLIGTRVDNLAVARKYIFWLATASVLVFTAVIGTLWITTYQYHRYNQKPIIDAYQTLAQRDPGPLIYTGSYRFSAVFYTRDHVTFTARPRQYITDTTFYMAVRDMWNKSTSRSLLPRCHEVIYRNDFHLWYCPAIPE